MKSTDFSSCLKQAANVVGLAGASAVSQELNQLADVFAAGGSKKVSDVVAKLNAISTGSSAIEGRSVGSLVDVLEAVGRLLATTAPKAAPDFEVVSTLLKSHAAEPLDGWLQLALEMLQTPPAKKSTGAKKTAVPPNKELVDRYERILEGALGDDAGFRDAYAQLENDPAMRAVEMALLAKQFAVASAKARPAALKKIFARHQALMISRAASAATAGRIAG